MRVTPAAGKGVGEYVRSCETSPLYPQDETLDRNNDAIRWNEAESAVRASSRPQVRLHLRKDGAAFIDH